MARALAQELLGRRRAPELVLVGPELAIAADVELLGGHARAAKVLQVRRSQVVVVADEGDTFAKQPIGALRLLR